MRYLRTEDQEFFRATTARFLTELVPPAQLRAQRDDPAGFDLDYWRRGAELGWTSLLVSEADGGGSISDDGLVDLSIIAYEFGAHAAPAPLVPSNIVAAALERGPLARRRPRRGVGRYFDRRLVRRRFVDRLDVGLRRRNLVRRR